jgi:hypothetical protein
MNCARHILRRLLLAMLLCSPASLFAGDGPQNTGSLILGLPSGHDQEFEAQLQIDRKVLTATFGTDAGPDALLQLFELSVQGAPCIPGPPSVIGSEDVVTAALRYRCNGSGSSVTVRLAADQQIPEGFTLGVRTAFDHFVLSRADGMSRSTVTSSELLFFKAGLAYTSGGAALEGARIGRAHALYYGGLTILPPGSWLLLLVLAVWCAGFSPRRKIILSAASVVVTGVIAAFVMHRQASLNLIPVRPLGFIYLGLLAGCAAASFIRSERCRQTVQIVLLTAATLASGLEHAVILRWLEGQDQVHMPAAVAAFMSGTAVAVTLIVAVCALGVRLLIKSPDARQRPAVLALPLLLLLSWPALALLMKWI